MQRHLTKTKARRKIEITNHLYPNNECYAYTLDVIVIFPLLRYTMFVVEKLANILINGLKHKLKIHHSVYRLPCTSEYLEELIAETLDEAGYKNDWQPNRSHSVSVDITLDSSPTISVKSGIYNSEKDTLKFSGSRLSKHETLDDMLKHIRNSSADYYVCLAKRDQDWSSIPAKHETKIYWLFVFDAKVLDYQIGVWTESGNDFKYESIGIGAKISASMSYQLWTTAHLAIVGKPYELEINV